TSEATAIAAVKAARVQPGDVMVLMGIGPGCGMPETYQVTAALKYVKDGQRIALITDGRFSGVSTGACVGHVSPEAWADGPIARIQVIRGISAIRGLACLKRKRRSLSYGFHGSPPPSGFARKNFAPVSWYHA